MKTPVILAVDDVALNFLVIENLLLQTDCQLVVAANGKEAVDKFIEAQYELILMDLRMPVMDGMSAVRLIRHLERLRNVDAEVTTRTPIVMLSASMDDRQAALAAGCDDYLVKPLDSELLSQTFAKHLGAYKAGACFIRQARGTPPSIANYPSLGIR